MPAVKMLKTKGHAGELKFDHTTKELRAFVRRAPPVLVCPRAQGTPLYPFPPPLPVVRRGSLTACTLPCVSLPLCCYRSCPTLEACPKARRWCTKTWRKMQTGRRTVMLARTTPTRCPVASARFRRWCGVAPWGSSRGGLRVPQVPPCRALSTIRPRLFLPMPGMPPLASSVRVHSRCSAPLGM